MALNSQQYTVTILLANATVAPTAAMRVTRAISLTNFFVASSALGFQVFVLCPWHKKLDIKFEELKKEHLRVLDAVGNSLSEQQRKTFTDKFNDMKSRSSKWWW